MPQSDEIIASSPVRRTRPSFTETFIEPLSRFQNEVDRLFEELPTRWPAVQLGRISGGLVPAVEMTASAKAFKLSVEVPGIDAADIDMHVHDGAIFISGEKKVHRDEEEKGYSYSERSYGSFERRIELPPGTDSNAVKAKVRNGVLEVMLPKKAEAAGKKQRIPIDS